ncbi:MAG: MarR family transcriptional regulator [Bdellovibrionales bacterium]|nr:MarR family transcriptional regulator [Bdellovibrionales bacterium]
MSKPLFFDMPKEETIRAIADQYPQADPSAIEASLLLTRISGEIIEFYEKLFLQHGLSYGRFAILMLLSRESGGVSPSDLAQRSNVTRATITGLLDGLQQKGLIRRIDDPRDHRACLIHMTPKAHKLIARILPHHFDRMCAVMKSTTPTDRKGLIATLKKIKTGLANAPKR